MADVIGASLYKLVNAMAGNEVTDAEAKEATAGKTYGDVSNELTAEIVNGSLPIGGGGGGYSVSEKIGYSGSYSLVYNSETGSYQDTIPMSEDMIEWVEKNTSPGDVPSYIYIEISLDGQSQLFTVRPSFESFTIEIVIDDSFLDIVYDKAVNPDKLTLDFTEEKSGSVIVKFFDVNVSNDFAKAVNTAITSVLN